MAKPRASHAPCSQQELFVARNHGGRRRGAGRRSTKARPGRRHVTRREFRAQHPIHVVLRVERVVGSLRRRTMYHAVRAATITAAVRGRIRIVHLSLQRSHLHMLVEAADRGALARGLQGFQISCARYINLALAKEHTNRMWPRTARRGANACRRGRVFSGRYYAELITSRHRRIARSGTCS